MAKIDDFNKGRMAGLQLAHRIAREDGIEALDREIKFRGKTGINQGVELKVLNQATAEMNHMINETHILIWLSILHDEFDFGAKRLNRAMDAVKALNESLKEDLWMYLDYRELVEAKMKRILDGPALDRQTKDLAKEKGQPKRDPVKPESKEVKCSNELKEKCRNKIKNNQGRKKKRGKR